jgi:hypothetical protein
VVTVVSRVAVLVALSLAASAPGGADENAKKGKRPGLELRATPRFAFSPAEVLFTAELKGGDDVEELYCPEVEWEWGDGGKSVQEADCDPWAPGMAIQRRYTANHTYPYAGTYRVEVRLRRSGKTLLTHSVSLTIRPGLGDRSLDPGS